MAIQTNSQSTYAAIGIREDLTNIVALIDPQETPLISNIGTGPACTTTKHEWQVQPLAAAVKTNKQLEGDDTPSAAAATARTRIYNICTISRKVGSVTGTMSKVEVAGISNELDNQKMLKGVELRRDMEVMLADNVAYDAGSAGTARQAAGLGGYITNIDTTAGYGATNWTAGSGTGAIAWGITNATARALSLTSLNGAVQNAYINGGKPNLVLMSPGQKTAFSNLVLQSSLGGAAQIRQNIQGNKAGVLIGTVDTWLSNFSLLEVAVDVHYASDSATTNGLNNTIHILDTKHAAVSYLRPMFTEDLAKTGDANKFEVIAEYTLQVDAPKAHAALFWVSSP